MSTFERTRRFHQIAGMPAADAPTQIPRDRRELRIRLTIEEVFEMLAELMPAERSRAWLEGMKVELLEDFPMYVTDHPVDLLALAHELADVDVVNVGHAVEFGIPHDKVIEAIADSNDLKIPNCRDCGPCRADGLVAGSRFQVYVCIENDEWDWVTREVTAVLPSAGQRTLTLVDPFGTSEEYDWTVPDGKAITRLTDRCRTCKGSGKAEPRRRDDGKILKPDGWVPADLSGVVA